MSYFQPKEVADPKRMCDQLRQSSPGLSLINTQLKRYLLHLKDHPVIIPEVGIVQACQGSKGNLFAW
jgi:hypothetical protein